MTRSPSKKLRRYALVISSAQALLALYGANGVDLVCPHQGLRSEMKDEVGSERLADAAECGHVLDVPAMILDARADIPHGGTSPCGCRRATQPSRSTPCDVSRWCMRAPPRWIPALAALIWAAWILYLGTDDRRQVVGFSGISSEALQHIVAFAVLGALAMATARQRPWAVFGLVALAGAAGEFVQLAASDRTFSFADMAFSVTGAAIGVAAVRSTGWLPTVALVATAGLLIAVTPIVLELPDAEPATSLAGECSAPPHRPMADPRPSGGRSC